MSQVLQKNHLVLSVESYAVVGYKGRCETLEWNDPHLGECPCCDCLWDTREGHENGARCYSCEKWLTCCYNCAVGDDDQKSPDDIYCEECKPKC